MAKSKVEKKLRPGDHSSEKEETDKNVLEVSSDCIVLGDKGKSQGAPDLGSKGQNEDEVSQTHSPENPQVEEEVDPDDSVFSDQDEEDFDNANNDSEWFEGEEVRHRYEVTSWYYHVREAERLWPPDERKDNANWQVLLDEMERFFLLQPVAFEVWKLAYVDYWQEAWDPLLFAAVYGLTSLAELLLDMGAKVMNLWQGYSSLHIASEAPNQLEMLKLFLCRGGDPNFEDSQIPAFHEWLIFDMDDECVSEFLRNNASCSIIDRGNGWNALHYFASYGTDQKILNLLLDNPFGPEYRADINVRDKEGETPLHKLLGRQKIPIGLLEAFLTRGADVNIDDKDSNRPLYEAARWGENAAIKVIINKVADVDDDSIWGRTALHSAAWAGQKETVKLLLEHGADVDRRDKHNRTALFFACLTYRNNGLQDGSHETTAELLLEEQIKRGASFNQINACTKRGRTPLREAAGRGFVRVVSVILEHMMDENKEWINKRDERKGRAPLHSAATHGRGNVVSLLLSHGADPSLRDGKEATGMTSLELCLDRWAIVGSQRYETAIAHLIDASVNEAKENKFLLTTAAIHGSIQVLEKLTKLGVNLDLPDAYGWRPSQLASQFDHAEAAKFIKKSLASRALRPTRWTLEGEPETTTLQDDGRWVQHQGDLRLAIFADHPVPAGLSMYYYEIEILDPKTGEPHGKFDQYLSAKSFPDLIPDSKTAGDQTAEIVAFGFCTSSANLIEFPGWPPKTSAPKIQSWAYHGDDGGIYASNGKKWPIQFDKHYGPGDTAGCGLDVDAQRIFFTRNGVRIGKGLFRFWQLCISKKNTNAII